MQIHHNFQAPGLKAEESNPKLETILVEKDKEIDRLKLENEMLKEEVNLLNYTIREEEKKVA